MLNTDGEEATDLDQCRGHSDETRGYHYHSAGPGENAFIGCFAGKIVQSERSDGPSGGEEPPESTDLPPVPLEEA